MNTSIHTVQPDDHHKTELMSEANRRKLSLYINNNVVYILLSFIRKNNLMASILKLLIYFSLDQSRQSLYCFYFMFSEMMQMPAMSTVMVT